MGKYLRISSYIMKPFLIYDFATAPLWISFYMGKIWFSFLSVCKFNLPNFFRNDFRENSTLTSLSLLSYSNDKDSCSTMCGVWYRRVRLPASKRLKNMFIYLPSTFSKLYYLFMFWNAKQVSKREHKPPHHKKLKTYLTFLNHFVWWVMPKSKQQSQNF
jgi:hypothetical protein